MRVLSIIVLGAIVISAIVVFNALLFLSDIDLVFGDEP